MYRLFRNLLFKLDAETSHDLALGTLSRIGNQSVSYHIIQKLLSSPVLNQPRTVMGIDFPNPVGLAAGLDKQGTCANIFHALGFGWTEMGTVTPLPQPGNPKPRMFRLQSHQALINRMGFNSIGLDAFLENIQKTRTGIIKGINIGKNAATPMSNADQDYITGLQKVYSCADYVAINISSPNTKNLRDLQDDASLDNLLGLLDEERQKLADQWGRRVPLVLKIAPDITTAQIESIARLSRKHHIDGIAATNTTVERDRVSDHPFSSEAGGLSGVPLDQKATQIIQDLYNNLQGEIALIGVGGIHDTQSAKDKLDAGADLLQVYTGFIYKGPALIKQVLRATKK